MIVPSLSSPCVPHGTNIPYLVCVFCRNTKYSNTFPKKTVLSIERRHGFFLLQRALSQKEENDQGGDHGGGIFVALCQEQEQDQKHQQVAAVHVGQELFQKRNGEPFGWRFGRRLRRWCGTRLRVHGCGFHLLGGRLRPVHLPALIHDTSPLSGKQSSGFPQSKAGDMGQTGELYGTIQLFLSVRCQIGLEGPQEGFLTAVVLLYLTK